MFVFVCARGGHVTEGTEGSPYYRRSRGLEEEVVVEKKDRDDCKPSRPKMEISRGASPGVCCTFLVSVSSVYDHADVDVSAGSLREACRKTEETEAFLIINAGC